MKSSFNDVLSCSNPVLNGFTVESITDKSPGYGRELIIPQVEEDND